MKERVVKGWNLRRALYLAGGIAALVMGIMDHDWMIGVFGAYFAVMGIFSFGCASGSCNIR